MRPLHKGHIWSAQQHCVQGHDGCRVCMEILVLQDLLHEAVEHSG